MNQPLPDPAHERWRKIREGGEIRYVLLHWVLPAGLPLGVAMAMLAMVMQAMRSNLPVTPSILADTPRLLFYLLLYLSLVSGIFCVLARGRWNKNENRYLSREKNDDR